MSWWLILSVAEWTVRLVMVAVILRRRFAPATALAWLSVIFLLPELGLPLYLLIGGNRLGRRRVRLHRETIVEVRTDARLAEQAAHTMRPEIEPAQLPVVLQAERTGGMPILAGNHVELMRDNEHFITALLHDIDKAREHVHLLFYIFANDTTARRVCDAMIRAAARGVTCRVLADATGSRQFFKRNGLAAELMRHGVRTLPMLPVHPLRRKLARIDLRNHRKLAVIDGRVGYTGSQNIVDTNYGHRSGPPWIDLMGRFVGPVVAQLQLVFEEDWAFETGEDLERPSCFPPPVVMGEMSAQTVPTGPSEDDIDALPRVLLTALNAAQRKIIITSPYLVPDEPTLLALAMAADRGVEVMLVLPEVGDHPLVAAAGRAYYDTLLDSGIDIYLYRGGLLHAKTMTVDDSFALLGSSNMDIRSFYLNFELNVLMFGPQITNHLRFAQSRYMADAVRVDREQWRRRPWARRYLDQAAALLSPLL